MFEDKPNKIFFSVFFLNSCLHSQLSAAPVLFLSLSCSLMDIPKSGWFVCLFAFQILNAVLPLWFPWYRFSESSFIMLFLFLYSSCLYSSQPSFPLCHTRCTMLSSVKCSHSQLTSPEKLSLSQRTPNEL